MSKSRKKYRQEWEALATILKARQRPKTFNELWALMPPKVCGLYEVEARAVWNWCAQSHAQKIVEIGRNLGGGLFLFACALPHLREVVTIDIDFYNVTDREFPAYFDSFGIRCQMVVQDSATYKPNPREWYNLVWIDGSHTGAGVRADIENWRGCTRHIGFHDYADRGRNKHVKCFRDVVAEISWTAARYGWEQCAERGKSDIIFEVPYNETR